MDADEGIQEETRNVACAVIRYAGALRSGELEIEADYHARVPRVICQANESLSH